MYDELHKDDVKKTVAPEPSDEGFIGRHMKKLREQEIAKDQAVKAIEDDTQEFGSPLPKSAYVEKI